MILRTARHTSQLKAMIRFYTEVIGLELLGSFENHSSYNGVFLGKAGENWQLEFTTSHEITHRTFDEDDLLVFYPTEKEAYQKILDQLEKYGIQKRTPKNPYWQTNGILIKDPDGHGIIISPQKLTD